MSGAPPKISSQANPFAANANGFGAPLVGFGKVPLVPQPSTTTTTNAFGTIGFSKPPAADTKSVRKKSGTTTPRKSVSPGAKRPDPTDDEGLEALSLVPTTAAARPSTTFGPSSAASNTESKSNPFGAPPSNTFAAKPPATEVLASASPSPVRAATAVGFGSKATAINPNPPASASLGNTAAEAVPSAASSVENNTMPATLPSRAANSAVVSTANTSAPLERVSRPNTCNESRWEDGAREIHAHNKRKLEKLSALVMLTRGAQDACEWEAALGLEKNCLEHLAPIAEELDATIKSSEKVIERLRKDHALLSPSSGAVAGEDAQLTHAWRTKEKDFINMFLRHRDRYLALQQNDALRQLAEMERGGILAQVSDDRRYAYAHNRVAREYLRPDL